jgi:hypothetical protein
MNPRIVSVKAKDNFTLDLIFENGQERIFDMKPYLKARVFRELTDTKLFKTVKPFMGSILWKNGQDLCPDTLYLESVKRLRSSNKENSLVVSEPRAKYRKVKRK